MTYSNVLFADNYFQSEDFPEGEEIGGSFKGDLNAVLNSILLSKQHEQVHTYYHGTINLEATAADDELIVESWYQNTTARNRTGFNYSRYTGADVLRPLGGVNRFIADAGGTGDRLIIDLSAPSWPNASFDQRSNIPDRVPVGQTVSIPYQFCDRGSQQTVAITLDGDTNPFNGEGRDIGSTTHESRSAGSIGAATFPWIPTAADIGTHFIRVKTTNARADGVRVRFDYFLKQIIVTDPNGGIGLPLLTAPTLAAPADGATEQSNTPIFSWSAVADASSYRLMIAPDLSALPMDPTAADCAGCVVNETVASNSFSLVNTVLLSSKIYYWQVHARSPSVFGRWSSRASFTTVKPDPGSIISGETVTGILRQGQTLRFPFSAPVGAGIVAAMGDPGNVSGFEPSVQIYGPDGTLLGDNWGSAGSSVMVKATQPGTHYLVAGDFGGNGGGAYNLSFARLPGAQAADPVVGGLQSGGMVSGILKPGELKVVAFETASGAGIVAAMGDPGNVSGFEPSVQIYGPDGTLLGDNWGSAGSSVMVKATQPGTHYLVAGDFGGNGGGAFTLSLTGAITPNRPPILSLPVSQPVDELSVFVVAATATDPDTPPNALTYRLVSGPPGASIHSITGVLTWTPTESQGPRSNEITVQVTDDGNPPLSDTKSFSVIVNEVNSPPVLAALNDRVVAENTTIRLPVIAEDYDLPKNTLTFSLGANAPAGAVIDPATGILTWTTGKVTSPETNVFTVTVTDNGSPALSDTKFFAVIVSPPALHLSPILDVSVDEGGLVSFTATPIDSPLAQAPLAYSLEAGAPQGAVINSTSGVFFWRPSESQGPSTNVITVSVQDRSSPPFSATQKFTILVREVNRAPVLEAIPRQTVALGRTLTARLNATDEDLPANGLRYSLEPGAPDGATIDPVTGIFTWAPGTSTALAAYEVTVRVVDDGVPALSDTKSFFVVVAPPTELSLTAALLPSSLLQLSFDTDQGRTYFIEASANLRDWELMTSLVGTGGRMDVTDTLAPGSKQRFYRAVVP